MLFGFYFAAAKYTKDIWNLYNNNHFYTKTLFFTLKPRYVNCIKAKVTKACTEQS